MAAVVNSSYLIPVSDLRAPIEGLIGVDRREERAILCFDSIKNRELFYQDVRKSPEIQTIRAVMRVQTWGYTAQSYEHSKDQCFRHCLLSYWNRPFLETNVFDWLMKHWKGNSADPKRGFVSRIFEYAGWANTSPRGSPASYKDPPQILLEEDESSPEPPSTPRSSDTRLKKHFHSPTEQKERTAVKRCHDGTEKRYW